MSENPKIILDLCGGTGAWSRPYAEAVDKDGNHLYDVRNITSPEYDVRNYAPPPNVYGILAAPPCTEFASSGARWWKTKNPKLLEEGIVIVRACLTIIWQSSPIFWALENPIGRIQGVVPELGKPRMYFDPCDFGDPYTKRTALWGLFNKPVLSPVQPSPKSPIHFMAPSPDRQKLRSITPTSFARAFFEANR